jgi:hypothetical protein
MAVDITEPSPQEIDRWFLNVADPQPGTFEFALVLGGTVSAGAYTAGAVDFLIEALDCFTAAQQRGEVPPHKVVLKLITGTSGGGVNAAIAARALAYDFPHITRGTPIQGQSTNNPFTISGSTRCVWTASCKQPTCRARSNPYSTARRSMTAPRKS